MQNWIDIEIIKPPNDEYLNFLCINDEIYPLKIDKQIFRIKLSSLKSKSHLCFYFGGILYSLIAYERSVDGSGN